MRSPNPTMRRPSLSGTHPSHLTPASTAAAIGVGGVVAANREQDAAGTRACAEWPVCISAQPALIASSFLACMAGEAWLKRRLAVALSVPRRVSPAPWVGGVGLGV